MQQQIVFSGDMSSTLRSKWIRRPSAARAFSLGIGWPATGTPTGTLAVEISDHGVNGVAGTPVTLTIPAQPAGSAGGWVIDNIPCTAAYIAVTYTRTSGGAGANLMDSQRNANSKPSICFGE